MRKLSEVIETVKTNLRPDFWRAGSLRYRDHDRPRSHSHWRHHRALCPVPDVERRLGYGNYAHSAHPVADRRHSDRLSVDSTQRTPLLDRREARRTSRTVAG